jgi:hypothetical protein
MDLNDWVDRAELCCAIGWAYRYLDNNPFVADRTKLRPIAFYRDLGGELGPSFGMPKDYDQGDWA